MKILIKEYRRYQSNTLQAFVDIEFLDLCLVIKGCTVHQKNGRAWIGFPGRKYTDKEGNTQYENFIQFSDDNKKEDFRKSAVNAVRQFVINEKQKEQAPPADPTNDVPF